MIDMMAFGRVSAWGRWNGIRKVEMDGVSMDFSWFFLQSFWCFSRGFLCTVVEEERWRGFSCRVSYVNFFWPPFVFFCMDLYKKE